MRDDDAQIRRGSGTVPGATANGELSWRGRMALGLFGVHVALLIVPPLPPFWKGSISSYVLGYAAVLMGALEVARRADDLGAWWSGLAPSRRLLLSYGSSLTLLSIGGAVLVFAPELAGRLAREEGLWDPLTFFLFLGSAILLLTAARRVGENERAAGRWLAGGAFALMAAEELDYLGVMGMLIGRVDGVYVGSPHDLLRLWSEGVAPPPIAAVVALPVLTVVAFLWRRGFLSSAALKPLLRPLPLAGITSAIALFGIALAGEAAILGPVAAHASTEEMLEAAGAVLLAAVAIEVGSEAA